AEDQAKYEAQFNKFLQDYIQEDAFERLKLDPKAFFIMKAALLWERATALNAKVEQMKKQSCDTVSGVNT
ncbi:hypothetical protein A2U01_0112228, partial [Trifolium medium]|nr:hypothetical protein [Trifolium medium]